MFSRSVFIALSAATFALAQIPRVGIPYRIYSAADNTWAKTSASDPTSVVLDRSFGRDFEHWVLQTFEDGFTIQNQASGYWLDSQDDTVLGVPELAEGSGKWYIEPAGAGTLKITAPGQDSVWTAQAGSPTTITLEGADGSDAQLWFLGFTD